MSRTIALDLTADVIATADIIERIEELDAILADETTPNAVRDIVGSDVAALRAIMDELATCGGGDEKWEGQWYPGLLIADHYFTDYARAMLEDCGTIPADLPHWVEIDWDATARNVRIDYTPVEINGRTYWTR